MADRTWTNGNATGILNDALNWDTGLPNAGDNLVFDGAVATDGITVDVVAGVYGTLTVKGNYTGAMTLQVAIEFGAGDIGNVSASNFTVDGAYQIKFTTFDLDTGDVLNLTSSADLYCTGAVTCDGTITPSTGSVVTCYAGLTITGQLGVAATDFDLIIRGGLAESTGTLIAPNASGEFNFYTGTNTWFTPSTFTHSSGTLTIIGSGDYETTLGNDSTGFYDIDVANFSILNLSTFAFTCNNLDIGGGGSGTVTTGTGIKTINGTLNIGTGASFGSADTNYTLDLNGNMLSSTGTLIAPNSSGTFTFSGTSWSNPTTFTHSSGLMTWDRAGTSTLATNSTGFYALTIADGATFASSTYAFTVANNMIVGGGASGIFTTSSGTKTVTGTLTLNASSSFGTAATTYTLVLTGGLTGALGTLIAPQAAGSFTYAGATWYTPSTFTHSSGTVTFNIAGTTALGNASIGFYNVTLTTGGVTLNTSAASNYGFTTSNTLTVSASAVFIANASNISIASGVINATLYGLILTGAGATFNGGSGTHTISSIIVNTVTSCTLTSGTTTINGRGGTNYCVIVSATATAWSCNNGTYIQTVGGQFVLSKASAMATALNIVQINTSGVTQVMTIGGSITILGTLDVPVGGFSTSGSSITVNGAATFGGAIYTNTSGTQTFNSSFIMSGGSTGYVVAGTSTIIVYGTWSNDYIDHNTFRYDTSTIIMRGNVNFSASAGSATFYKLQIDATYTVTFLNSLAITNVLTVNGTAKTSVGTKFLDVGYLQPVVNPLVLGVSADVSLALIRFYVYNTNYNVPGASYYHLHLFSNAGYTGTLQGNIITTSDFAVASIPNDQTCLCDTAGYSITANGGIYVSATGATTQHRGGGLICNGSVIDTTIVVITQEEGYINFGTSVWTVSSHWTCASTYGSWDAGTGSVTFDGGAQNLIGNSKPIYDCIFGGTSTKTMLTSAWIISHNMTINASVTLTTGANLDITVSNISSVAGTMTCNASNVTLGSGVLGSYAITITNTGIFNGGSGTQTIGSIKMNTTTSTVTFTTGTMTINGNGASSIAIYWGNTVTFDDGNGTIIFIYAGNQYLYDEGTGNKTLYNVTVNHALSYVQGVNAYGPNITIGNNFTINAGTWSTQETSGGESRLFTVVNSTNVSGTFLLNNSTCSFYTITVTSPGVLNATGTSTSTISGNWESSSGTYQSGSSTIQFTATCNVTTKSNGEGFYNIIIDIGQTVTMIATWSNIYNVTTVNGSLVCSLSTQVISIGYQRAVVTPLIIGPSGNVQNTKIYYYVYGTDYNIAGGAYGYLHGFSNGNYIATLQGSITCQTTFAMASIPDGFNPRFDTVGFNVTCIDLYISATGANTRSGNMKCGASTIITTNLVITNATGYLIMDSSTWYVSGTWNSNSTSSTWDSGTSSVNIVGTTTQSIKTSGQPFYNLIINNTHATLKVTFSDHLEIDNGGTLEGIDGQILFQSTVNLINGTLKFTGVEDMTIDSYGSAELVVGVLHQEHASTIVSSVPIIPLSVNIAEVT